MKEESSKTLLGRDNAVSLGLFEFRLGYGLFRGITGNH
jgi:hypothetical protein